MRPALALATALVALSGCYQSYELSDVTADGSIRTAVDAGHDPGAMFSCVPTGPAGICEDLLNGFAGEAAAMEACSGGAVSTTPCPTAGRVGRCTLTEVALGFSVRDVFYPPISESEAQMICDSVAAAGAGYTATFEAD